MKYIIEVLDKKKSYYWRLVHKNGKILAHSENYSSSAKAMQTAANVANSFKKGTCHLASSL